MDALRSSLVVSQDVVLQEGVNMLSTDLALNDQLTKLYFYCNSRLMISKLVAAPLLTAVFELAARVTSKTVEFWSVLEREQNLNMYLMWDNVEDGQVSWFTIKHSVFLKSLANISEAEKSKKLDLFVDQHPCSITQYMN